MIEAIKFLKLIIIAALIAAIIAINIAAALITSTTKIKRVVDVRILAQNLASAGSHCLEMQTATMLVAPLISKMKLQVFPYRPVTHKVLKERVRFPGL
jgi:hypothetical protein